MSHYFINDNNLVEEEFELKYYFNDKVYKFLTNRGIFSYKNIDYASNLLVKNIDNINGNVLDYGCGYGFIGISLIRVMDFNLYLTDINKRALEYTKKNLKLNNVNASVINIYDNELNDDIDLEKLDVIKNEYSNFFNNILLNPPIHSGKRNCYQMYLNAKQMLVSGGSLYIVTLKKHGAESTINYLKEIYKSVEVLYKKKGFFIIKAKNE